MKNYTFLALCLFLFLIITPEPAYAADFMVGDAASLIAAINTANGNGEDDVIILTNNITLTTADNSSPGFGANGLPVITPDGGSNLSIIGQGFAIQRYTAICDFVEERFRILQVDAGAELHLIDVTIRNGCEVTGSGIDNSGELVIINSIITENSDDAGISNGGYLRIMNSTISYNSGYTGGGIYSIGTLDIVNSTISHNTAGDGAGIAIQDGSATLSNVTISDNIGSGLHGGGILIWQGDLTINNSTIVNNQTGDLGGGIMSEFATAQSTVSNTIVSGNTDPANNINNCEFTVTTSYSVLGTDGTPACPDTTMNIIPAPGVLIDDIVSPLANNGAVMQTHALVAGSPALDNSGTGATTTDQRGVPANGNRDIGAYEFGIDPTYPVVQFASSGLNYNETDGTVSLGLTISGAVNFAGVAEVYIVDSSAGTASSGSDYASIGLRTVTIDCSSGTCPSTMTVPLTIISDAITEVDETAIPEIVATNGFATIGATNRHIATIQDAAFTPLPTTIPPINQTDADSNSESQIEIFDPAISKIGFLVPGQTGVTGEQLEWVVTVTNTGTVSGNNIVVTDTLIDSLQIDRVEAPGGTVNINGQTVSVSYPALSPGQSVQFSIFTTVLDGVSVNNTACINADNQAGEICATGSAIAQLPQTGETPFYRHWLFIILLSFVTLLSFRRIARQSRYINSGRFT